MFTPELNAGDVVVFENLKLHLARSVTTSIKNAGAKVLSLLSYISDYDPIEELRLQFKGQLRQIAALTRESLYNAVGEALDHVTVQDIAGRFNHSGLYVTRS